ncbi:hypothetical protein [Hoeflea sp. TYP-13]|uniref:aspartate racemase/maleate isomerase family protein n=1 Tax=Hoeflea sp. TYP-13 TaxID=3230023 RepID=UPI0034C63C42
MPDITLVDSLPGYSGKYANRSEAEAVFFSCGVLRSVDIAKEAERRLNKPVICSNQASMWYCPRLAGIGEHSPGWGILFEAA